jgi:hypothetical protein
MGIRFALAVAAALGIGGCGGDEDHANHERPPATINVTAAIADGRIHVSPREFGAGPIRLLVSNQTASAQEVTFETAGDASGVTQTSAPISPQSAATLEVEPTEGEYELSTGDDAIQPVAVQVGAPRPSAQNELLQP